jgi:dynein heavy chain
MLMAEGFRTISQLTKKFTTFYPRCEQLLSKHRYYDWGLRAVKSVLVFAGALLLSDPNMSEEAVSFRALQYFDGPKIIMKNMQMVSGLINDLLTSIDVSR